MENVADGILQRMGVCGVSGFACGWTFAADENLQRIKVCSGGE